MGNGEAHGGDLAAFAAQDAGLLLFGGQEVDFVVEQELRHLGRADFGQHAVDVLHALLIVGLGNVGHMEQYVGLGGFLQRGGEGGHQAVRQVAHEADGVGEDDAVLTVEIQAAGGGVERGEELVFGQHVGFGEAVKQTGFAGVGVAHQGESGQAALLAGFAAGGTLAAHVGQAFFQGGDFLGDQAAVGFELGFARAFEADAAFLALQVAVAAHQTAGEVGELRQLHLQAAFLALRALGENGKDEPHAVEHAALQLGFEVALLRGRELVVEHGQFDIVRLHFGRQLFGFAAAHKQCAAGAVASGGGNVYQLPTAGTHQLGGFIQHILKSAGALLVAAGETVGQHHAHQQYALGAAEGFVGLERRSARHGIRRNGLKMRHYSAWAGGCPKAIFR